ncbi:MAG: phage head-tail connector protein [Saprospiraceae bacterium]|nr:phage head-tail connector protein [Saprospiraceae bacterium]
MYQTGTYRVSVEPASEPLSPTEVKNWLKVDSSTDDDLITILIASARQEVERYCQIALLPQTIVETFNCFYSYGLRLSVSPLISVTSITYLSPGESSASTLSTDLYAVHPSERPPLVYRKAYATFPTVEAQMAVINVTYQAGYANAAAVPAAIKKAMLMLIADSYQNRQDSVKQLPTAVEYLLNPYRVNYFR